MPHCISHHLAAAIISLHINNCMRDDDGKNVVMERYSMFAIMLPEPKNHSVGAYNINEKVSSNYSTTTTITT